MCRKWFSVLEISFVDMYAQKLLNSYMSCSISRLAKAQNTCSTASLLNSLLGSTVALSQCCTHHHIKPDIKSTDVSHVAQPRRVRGAKQAGSTTLCDFACCDSLSAKVVMSPAGYR